MTKPKALRRLVAITMLCIAFYAALEIYLDVTIRFALVTYLYGQEQVVDVDFSQMPSVLRWANRFATFSISGLGLYFAFEARKLRYLRAPLMVYAVTLAWSAFLLLEKTTVPSEVLTTFSLFANFAPGTLAALGLFFAAAREDVWEVMREYLGMLVVAIGGLAILLVPFVQIGSRSSGRRYLLVISSVLQVAALSAVYLQPKRVPKILHYLPLLGAVACGILTQTRLLFILVIIQILTAMFLNRGRVLAYVLYPKVSIRTIALGLSVSLVLAAGAIYVATGPLRHSVNDFSQRLDEDTRSQQAKNFFAATPANTLIFAGGYPTNGEPTSEGTSGIDSGYLNAMFVGGVPALMVMLYFIVSPGVFLLWTRFTGAALQVTPVCVAAAVAYTSSVVFKISTALVVTILFAGRAFSIAFLFKAQRRLQPSSTRVTERATGSARGLAAS